MSNQNTGITLDKALQSEESFSTQENAALPFEVPHKFINIPNNVINEVSVYMSVVHSKVSPNRQVEVKRILENAQNMFRDGVKYNDDLWLHHCASSIREILTFVTPSEYRAAYQGIPTETDPDGERIFTFLTRAMTYLSSVVHFRDLSKIGDADDLYPNQGYGEKDLDVFLKEEADFFEKVCIDVVYTLHYLFVTYCAGNCEK